MQAGEIEITAFGPEHLAAAVRLSQEAGWPHRLEDWQVALELSKGMVAIDDHDNVVGTVLVTLYERDCATINMVIVDASMRGRGLGRRLMEAALAIGGERPLRLVATREGLPLYEKLGFRETGTILQHQGIVAAVASPPDTEVANAADLPAIIALDRQAFGADRSALVVKFFEIGEFAIIRRDGEIVGFSCIRPFGRGDVIGPVVAGGFSDARSLASHFLSRRGGRFVRVDTIDGVGLGAWLADHALGHVGGGVSMMRPPVARFDASVARTFALASQAFG